LISLLLGAIMLLVVAA